MRRNLEAPLIGSWEEVVERPDPLLTRAAVDPVGIVELCRESIVRESPAYTDGNRPVPVVTWGEVSPK